MITFAPLLDSATVSVSPNKFSTLTSIYTSVLTYDTFKPHHTYSSKVYNIIRSCF